MSGEKLYIGVVIPTYNERENIIKLLDELVKVLDKLGVRYRILVVDDNSPDGTAETVREYGLKNRSVEVLVRPGKKGLGSAIMDGFKKLLEDPEITHIVTMDADLSHRPEDLESMIKRVDEADVVQGSRYISGGGIVNWGLHRRLISLVANKLIKMLYHTDLCEHTTNYRIYSRRVVEDIVKYSTRGSSSYEWVVEALLIAIARGYRVMEAPIIFINREKGRSKLGLLDIIRWFIFILKFKSRFRELEYLK